MAKSKHNMASAKSNTTSVYITNSANSKHGVKKEVLLFTRVDACLIVLSLATLFIDICSDCILVVTYFMNGQTFWGSCTLALIIIPAVIMQGFSLRWYMLDGTSGKSLCIAHVCLLGVFLRYLGVLRTGQEARRSGEVTDFQLYFHQQSDVCMLHLFESFMESAPQLVLQFYIAIQMQHSSIWTGVSVAASVLSLTWSVSSYSRVMRRVRPEKKHISMCGLALQAVWRVGMIGARISALVLFAICCQAWLFLLLGLHWLGMTVWVILQKTDPNSTSLEEYAYNAVVGVVYCFCFFNLREGRARARMLAFYVVTVAQNLACLYLFLALKQHSYPFLAQFSAVTIVCGTVVGLGAMLLYYRFYHPSGPISLFGPPPGTETQSRTCQNNEVTRPPRAPSPSPLPSPSPSLPPTKTAPPAQNIQNDPEKSNSLRSLKHLWTVERDGSLSSRSDDMPVHGGSPQSDDGYTDKRLLLSSRAAPRRPIPSFGHTGTGPLTPGVIEPAVAVTAAAASQTDSVCATEKPSSPNQKLRTSISIEDSQISWNCPSLMEDTQNSDPVDFHLPTAVTVATGASAEPESSLNKRRGICSSVELGLDLLEDKIDVVVETPVKDESSFSVLCQKLVNAAEVKQLVRVVTPIENRVDKLKIGLKEGEKRESDYIDSKQSEVQSSDGTPSEVLSAHDYENICAVNIARETWGLRSWRGYSDIETWLHDDSVVRDRRRDTILSLATMASGASSERSTASESPPPVRQQWETAVVPPIPNRRPRPSYNRMDDYLDTLADDLAEIERRELNVFAAQPYQQQLPATVVDHNGVGMIYPMPPSQLDTIMEELEESSCTSTTSVASVAIGPAWASSLVATIDEIRTGTNTFDDTMTVSENDFDLGSYHSLQFDTSVDQSMRFSYSLPSLLQAPRSCSQLTPEKLLEQEWTNPPVEKLRVGGEEVGVKRGSNRPRRKVSLLRERFDKPVQVTEATVDDPLEQKEVSDVQLPSGSEVPLGSGSLKTPRSRHWNSYMKMQNQCNAQDNCLKVEKPCVDPFGSPRGKSVLKRVLTPPRLRNQKRTLVIASNASA